MLYINNFKLNIRLLACLEIMSSKSIGDESKTLTIGKSGHGTVCIIVIKFSPEKVWSNSKPDNLK